MALKTRIQSFAQDIDLIVRNDLSPSAQQEAIADFAKSEIAKVDETNRRILGGPTAKTVTVDGRPGAPLDSVNPQDGVIITEWELIGDVIEWIRQALADRSPAVSGRYRSGHMLFADGSLIESGGAVPPASEFVFVNSEPYARKIEVGKTKSGRDFVIQVPNRIYERTAKDAKGRFGNVAKIEFAYRPVSGGGIGAWAGTASARALAAHVRGGNASRHHDWLTSQPAIIVKLGNK